MYGKTIVGKFFRHCNVNKRLSLRFLPIDFKCILLQKYFFFFFFFFYSYNTNYSTTKLQTQLITTRVWGKENQSPHIAKPSTVKSYGHCSSIKKLKVAVTNVYEPVWLMHHFWLWCVQRWYKGFEAKMVTKQAKYCCAYIDGFPKFGHILLLFIILFCFTNVQQTLSTFSC